MAQADGRATLQASKVVIDSIRRTLDDYLSWRSLRWRWTALRTGRPVAEIALLERLVYRVEEVFLIQPESGLLMQHVAAVHVDAREAADQISSMLIALRTFVSSSFGGGAEQPERLRVGELSVSIKDGPHALLAGVVRGAITRQLEASFQDTLETIHLRYTDELTSFTGNPESLAATRPLLESCLLTQYRPPRSSGGRHQ